MTKEESIERFVIICVVGVQAWIAKDNPEIRDSAIVLYLGTFVLISLKA